MSAGDESNRTAERGKVPPGPALARRVEENIDALCQIRHRSEENLNRHQVFIERVSAFAGTPVFFYAVLGFVGIWIAVNLGMIVSNGTALDLPPFFWLQGILTFSSLLMMIVILIAQTRQRSLEKQNAQLDLQVSILSEQKIAKLIQLVEELRRDLPNVKNRLDPEANAMTEPTSPHQVVQALERGNEATGLASHL